VSPGWAGVDSRSVRMLAAVALVTGLLGLVAGSRVYRLGIATSAPERVVSLVELCSVLGAAVGPTLTTPRMWSWERAGGRRSVRVLSGLVAGAAVAGPVALPLLASTGAHDASVLGAAGVNACLIGATSCLVTVVVGPRAGAALALGTYLSLVLLDELTDLPWVPLCDGRVSPANAGVAVSTVMVAVIVAGMSCGRTQRAQRLMRSD
jgi:hypothetical protein